MFVSPISAWEVGLLGRPGIARRAALRFLPDAKTWFARVMGGPGDQGGVAGPQTAIDASYLPGDLHADPADRLIVATARHLGLPVVTRDRRIIAYAAQGHAAAVPG